MVAYLNLISVMIVFDFESFLFSFFVAPIILINMKFILLAFSSVLRPADLVGQPFSIYMGSFNTFAALSFKV